VKEQFLILENLFIYRQKIDSKEFPQVANKIQR